jgi:hypothetical protein
MMFPTHDDDGGGGRGRPDSPESSNRRGVGAFVPRSSTMVVCLLVVAFVASAAAAIGWTRSAFHPVAPSIQIVDVRPLHSPDPSLRDLITHTFAVRVAIRGWTLRPYQPGVTARDNRPAAGHWRLYLDGSPLGDNLGAGQTTYAYLPPGTHWLAAELSNADSSSLHTAVWSEPVIVHVPRRIRCWQAGWKGTPETGTPIFTCSHREA